MRQLWQRIPAAIAIAAMILMAAVDVVPQDMPVPVEIQLPLLLKILSSDRLLRARSGNELVIGVVYQRLYRASAATMEEMLEISEHPPHAPFPGQTVRLVPVPIEANMNWDSVLTALEVDVCYLTHLRAVELNDLLQITRAHQVITSTGIPDYVESGVAVGFDNKGGRPQIMINIKAAKLEGSDYSSQLLKLARIVEAE